ncbi:TonB-dependent receptor [Weeksellaceae bacterium TAE3-ERU29]|nr:TonB-dependent receptor [Weeksellaceae bacterium TAE3-ERU29]
MFNSTLQLDEVIITGVERVTARKSEDVAKIPLANLENPQVYMGITQALILQQKLYNLEDVVKNAPGISALGGNAKGFVGYGGESFISRGFETEIRALNGMATDLNLSTDIQNTSKIEVIRGPSATLFGGIVTSYGGVINRVTKKPYSTFGASVDYSGGSYAYQRLGVDVNVPLNKEKTFLSRLNVAIHNQGNNKDNGGYERGTLIAPSFTYKPNDDLSINISAEITHRENAGISQGIGVNLIPSQLNSYLSKILTKQGLPEAQIKQLLSFMPKNIKEMFGTNDISKLELDPYRSFVDRSLGLNNKIFTVVGDIDYKLSDHWTSKTSAIYNTGDDEGFMPRLVLIPNVVPALLKSLPTGKPDFGTPGADHYARIGANWKSSLNAYQIQQNFIGDFNIGKMRNRMVVGLDYYHREYNASYTSYVGNLFGIPFNQIFDTPLRRGEAPGYYNFNKINIEKMIAEKPVKTNGGKDNRTSTYAMYINDVLNITDQLILNAGVRVDKFDNKGSYNGKTNKYEGALQQTAIAPKFGLIYQVLKDKVTLFTNYQSGFKNVEQLDKQGNPFKPEYATQYEGGVKFSLFNDLFTGTASYYNIRVENVVRYDLATQWEIQDGVKTSKGFEVQLLGNPTPQFNILLGYAYNDSKYEKASADVVGLRPADAGAENQFNVWGHYHFNETSALNGLSIGAGMNYVGETMVFNFNRDGSLNIPAYTLANMKLSYDRDNYSFGLRVNNLLNEEVWTGSYFVSSLMQRQIVGSIAIKL